MASEQLMESKEPGLFEIVMTRAGLAFAVAVMLDGMERQGTDKDSPEGSRYITISDTQAKKFSAMLRGDGEFDAEVIAKEVLESL